MKSIRLALFTAAFLAAGFAQADTIDCKNPKDGVELGQCTGKDMNSADAKMNQAYRQLMAKVDTNAAAKLKTAQRLWIQLRDADCAFEGTGTEGGSIHSVVMASCAARLSAQRTQALNTWLKCAGEEGNTSCPAFK